MKNNHGLVSFLKQNILTLATLLGVVIGLILGVSLKLSSDEPWAPRTAMYISFLGKLFLNMLKCIIIPLVVPSLIAAIGSLDLSLSGKIAGRAIVYYMATTISAVILGIILVVSIKPGAIASHEFDLEDTSKERNVTTADTLMDLVRNAVPPNIVQAALSQYKTVLIYPGMNITDKNDSAPIYTTGKNTWMTGSEWSSSTNILGLVVFSVVTGVAISASGQDGLPLLRFFESLAIVMMRVTHWIIHLAPIGVLFLIAGQILGMKNMAKEFQALGLYFGTVVLGVGLHGLIVLPLLYTVITKSLPFRFVGNMGSALVTAFGTASSSATLPVTMKCLEEKNKVDFRISRFVLPIGATINMDGTALYEAVAAIFIAQLNGIYPDIGQIIAISITATAASIGAAGIPQAGLVTMVMVLDTVGLPSEQVAVILSVDWLLDRFRTAINVLGDSIGAGIVNHLSQAELAAIDDKEDVSVTEKDKDNISAELGMEEVQLKGRGISNDAYMSSKM